MKRALKWELGCLHFMLHRLPGLFKFCFSFRMNQKPLENQSAFLLWKKLSLEFLSQQPQECGGKWSKIFLKKENGCERTTLRTAI